MKKSHIVLLVFLAISLAGVFAMITDADQYQTFTSASQLPEGKASTVVGTLVEVDKIEYNPQVNPNLTVFYAQDKEGKIMRVKYFEPKPVDFERSEEVTITGKVVNDEFHASKMLVKCPSKYVEEDIESETAKR